MAILFTSPFVCIALFAVLLCAIQPSVSLEFIVSSQSQLQNTLFIVNPGDIVYISNRVIHINQTIHAIRNGTWDAPITVRGLGNYSELRCTSEIDIFHIQSNNWVFEGISLSGPFGDGFWVESPATNVTIRDSTIGLGYEGAVSVLTSGTNVLINNCTFLTNKHGVYYRPVNLFGNEGTTIVSNSLFITDDRNDAHATGIFASGNAFTSINNTFDIDIDNDQAFWSSFIMAMDTRLNVVNNVGRRAKAAGFLIVFTEINLPYHLQEYFFHGNHCNLYTDSWCVDVRSPVLYNRTFIGMGNTAENALGFTNIPSL